MARRSESFVSASSVKVLSLVLALAGATQAMAAENGLQRYSPGVGGSDMTTPLVAGWYVQMPMVAYHANKLKGGDGNTATSATPTPVQGPVPAQPNLRSEVGIKADTYALLPRVTYLDNHQILGANVGFTVMLPLVKRKALFTASPIFAGSTVPSIAQPGYTTSINARVAGQNGSEMGIGDIEVSPLLHWEIGDHQAVTLAPTIVLPTGDYNAAQRVNPGYGNFVTFRPSVQYAFIGDGWDVGARAVLSFNTRNKDNGYFSGNMFNLDWQLMKFVSDDVRVGLQGYFVRQLSKDTQDLSIYSPAQLSAGAAKEITNGNKASVNAAGPAVGWLKNGGEMLLEGKFLKEFDARNRTEGQAFWLTVSKPL
ncbi:SphA family protein [Aquabacterium sp.]|uniref:SphA family protein n=1 Tax=Aquabacterium sp. TaxID=1872578 RepID=UPI0040382395